MRRIALVCFVLVMSAGFYLLLIDTRRLEELYGLAGVAVLAALFFEISRAQGLTEARISLRWLRRAPVAIARVPRDIALVSVEAFAQLFSREQERGRFVAVPFEGGQSVDDHGRRALAEALGSVAPNTIVLGVDADRNLLLVHQLRRQHGRDEFDSLRLG